MTRTIVTLEENDKRWLDKYSAENGRSTAETIRQAIKEFQKKMREGEYKNVLEKVFGVLKHKEDSVKFVRKIREEWD